MYMRQSNDKLESKSIVSELEYFKKKCGELEVENKLLVEEQQQLYKKAHDAITSDNNVDSFLKENNMLQVENEKLIKLARQRKTDADLWKSKYENQLQQILQIKSNYEYEIKQLNGELQKVQAQMIQNDAERQRQLLGIAGQLESQSNSDFENLKKATNLQIEIAESQIRKLRDHIEEQNEEISDLQQKLLRQKQEDDLQIERLIKENELLRIKSAQQESEKQRELELMNDNLNNYSNQQIQLLKHEFARQSDVQQGEIDKLKGLLEIKNAEIETLLIQINKNKTIYEDEIAELKAEINSLKDKLIEQDKQWRNTMEFKQKDLITSHQREYDALKSFYENQLSNLDKEIQDLKDLIDHKNQQLQLHQEEKAQQRAQMENQIVGLRRELENAKIQLFETEKFKNCEISELEDQYQKSQSLSNEALDQANGQIQFLEGEIEKLKELLIQKTKELESNIASSSLYRKQLEDDIRRLKDEIHSIKQELLQVTSSKNQEITDLTQKNERLQNTYREKLRQADINLEQHQLELKRLREALAVKEQEFDNLYNQKLLSEKDLKRAREEIDNLKQKQLAIEKEKFQQLEDLKNKLESSNQYQISNLKAAFNTQISVLSEENKQLKNQLDQRRSQPYETRA